jgi:hypothetical protein
MEQTMRTHHESDGKNMVIRWLVFVGIIGFNDYAGFLLKKKKKKKKKNRHVFLVLDVDVGDAMACFDVLLRFCVVLSYFMASTNTAVCLAVLSSH